MSQLLFTIFIVWVIAASGQTQAPSHTWTILYYAAGCNSSEETLLTDLEEIQSSMIDHQGYRVIVLIDRIEGFSSDSKTFGEDFTDTRLYELTAGSYKRLNGKEFFPDITTLSFHDVNMGDALTLKQFIAFGKKYYPAKHYALFMYSHGDGISFCADNESNRDALYPAELTDVLTARESIDLMALDVCSMSGIELAYQWRPMNNKFSTDYMIASAPVSAPWDYRGIFSRLRIEEGTLGESNDLTEGKERYLNPKAMKPLDFGYLLIEEIFDSQPWCSWAFLDLSQAAQVKIHLDKLIRTVTQDDLQAAFLKAQQTTIDYIPTIDTQNLPYYRMRIPYFDFADLMSEARKHLDKDDQELVDEVLQAIDNLVLRSFYAKGGNFLRPAPHFDGDKNGVYIFFPFGKEIYETTGKTHWEEQGFYTPHSNITSTSYGNLAWCADGATVNNRIENWFELLTLLFQTKK